ncbi:MAG TPA: sugar transferase, partial [Chroococcales cyanobacterium]
MESLAERFNRSESAVIAIQPIQGLRCNNSLAKRAFDVTFALVALACSAPILIVCFIAISAQSRGWPIFVQRRVGRCGKVFNIFKLRTMYSGSDSHAFKTASDDHRLTPVGKLLRNANIDELPQLINIILGDMSVIGPRPLSVD